MHEMKIFEDPQFGEIRTIAEGTTVLFCGSDVAVALGYNNPRKALIDHCKGVTKRDTLTNGGVQTMSFITEGDVYRLIARSNLPNAVRFECWVFEEVLPSIRQTGGYLVGEDVLSEEELLEKALEVAHRKVAEVRRRNATLEAQNIIHSQQLSEMQPKARYHDLILQNKSTLSVTLIAKDYGMSAIRMNKLLHELGVQYRQGDAWLPYQRYAVQGYTQSRTHAIDAESSKTSTYWTQKGRLFLYNLLKLHGILPMIERSMTA